LLKLEVRNVTVLLEINMYLYYKYKEVESGYNAIIYSEMLFVDIQLWPTFYF